MAGIYIHIPFCKKACHYCDFHFSTSLKYMGTMVEAICTEIGLKKDRISGQVGSIYFGGGTPSILSDKALFRIFDAITQHFSVAQDAEITFEANPDDLNSAKIHQLRSTPVNRFSIGVQSFFDEDLQWMNRAHNADEAESCVKRSQDAGFENLSLDLIYGFELLSDAKWIQNIETAAALAIPHISAYALTVEGKTALAAAIQKGVQRPLSDEKSAAQFICLQEKLAAHGYQHYEISNFARSGRYAVHNTNYWRGVAYIGIGPSAHGFDGAIRYSNIANNALYIQQLLSGQLAETVEVLTMPDQFNEYVMTSLRTMWGLDMKYIEEKFTPAFYKMLHREMQSFLKEGLLLLHNNVLTLSPRGKLYADKIASELFILNEDWNTNL